MKKLGFILFITAFVLSCTQAQSQNDFHGKWIYEIDADSEVSAKIGRSVGGGKMEFTISAKTFTSVWTPSWVTYVSPVEENTFEIFSWEKIKNDNKDTMKDYPTGYLIGLRHGLGNTTSKLFMHRDKNSMISAYEDRDGYHQELFIKPCSQSDFYGTWTRTDEKGITYTYTFTDKEYTENSPLLSEKLSLKISSWQSIINKDNNTKSDYPTGFLVTDIISTEYYLHKNKKSLLWVRKHGDDYKLMR